MTTSSILTFHYGGPRQKRERERKGQSTYLKTLIVEKFPNLKKKTDVQVQEEHKVPNSINPKKTTPRNIVIKMAKIKDKEK